jgi:oxygen-independent coproporphyrinogen-3 oxidase
MAYPAPALEKACWSVPKAVVFLQSCSIPKISNFPNYPLPGIYIHIPFCKQACHYCNFHFSTSLRYKNEFIAALLKELEMYPAYNQPVSSVYFGGGTPSLLLENELEQILDAVRRRFGWAVDAEITLEANPDDCSTEKLRHWKNLGINRLSMGVQSFYEEDLRWMNRAHHAGQAIESLEAAVQVFDRINLDLIYGSPGLTDEKWRQNLQTAVKLGITHLSCYALTVEERTPLYKMIAQKQSPDVDTEQQSRQFYHMTDYLLDQGFEHYEISNFAKPGYRSRHNSSYWKGEHYLGLGPGAHSYDGTQRWWNVANNTKYIRSIMEGIAPVEKELLSPQQRWNEYVMIRLRTQEGLNLEELWKDMRDTPAATFAQWKESLEKELNHLQEQNLVVVNDNNVVLTREGKIFADGIAARLFTD